MICKTVKKVKKKMGLIARYNLLKAEDGQYYFVLRAVNGKIILTSEMYQQKAGALKGIKSVQKNGKTPTIIDKTEA